MLRCPRCGQTEDGFCALFDCEVIIGSDMTVRGRIDTDLDEFTYIRCLACDEERTIEYDRTDPGKGINDFYVDEEGSNDSDSTH